MITSNRCNNLQERLANGVICQWDEGTSNILLTLKDLLSECHCLQGDFYLMTQSPLLMRKIYNI